MWMTPTHVSESGDIIADFRAAFEPDAPWQNARKKTSVFKTYGNTIATLLKQDPDWIPSTMAPQLTAWRMGLAIEVGGATGASCNSDRWVGLELELASVTALRAKGVPVHALVMDSPLWAFVLGNPGACAGQSVDRAIADIIRYVKAMRSAFPEVQLGLTDPIPNRLLGPATLEADLAALRALYHRLATALVAEGLSLDFVQLDHPQNYRAYRGFPDWKHLVAVEDMLRYEFRVATQIIFNDQGGGETSSAEFRAQTLAMLSEYLRDSGRPNGYVVQSWFKYPDHVLPESDPNSYTGIMIDAAAEVAAHPAAPE
jgi:hypothetical protein